MERTESLKLETQCSCWWGQCHLGAEIGDSLDSAQTCWNLPQSRYEARLLELICLALLGWKRQPFTAVHLVLSVWASQESFVKKKVKEREGKEEGEKKKEERKGKEGGSKEGREGGRKMKEEQERKNNHLYNTSGISLICKPGTWLQYNNAIMLLPCLASCEQFSETSNNSGLVGNALKKKTTEQCKKRWILIY